MSLKIATPILSDSYHFSIRAEPSIAEKNSSSGTADSEPDHFRTEEICDMSLWTVGVPKDILIHSLNLWISALVSASSICKRVSVV